MQSEGCAFIGVPCDRGAALSLQIMGFGGAKIVDRKTEAGNDVDTPIISEAPASAAEPRWRAKASLPLVNSLRMPSSKLVWVKLKLFSHQTNGVPTGGGCPWEVVGGRYLRISSLNPRAGNF